MKYALYLSVFAALLGLVFMPPLAAAQDFLDQIEAEVIQDQAEKKAKAKENGVEWPEESEGEAEEDSIPEPYIEEANVFNQYCEQDSLMRRHYDCECLAANFLDTRIQKGVHMKRTHILGAIEKTCVDASEAAFYEYTECKGNSVLLPKDVSVDTYCSCFGNEYAKIFEKRKLVPTRSRAMNVQTLAHSICSKDNYAKKNYGEPAPR